MQKVIKGPKGSGGCRFVSFSEKSSKLFSGYENGEFCVVDVENGQIVASIGEETEELSPIYTIKPLSDDMVFVGDDDGVVKLYDVRSDSKKPAVHFKNTTFEEDGEEVVTTDDWVSEIMIIDSGYKIVASRSDGTIKTYSTRRGGREVCRSESLGAELTGMSGQMKNGRKLVVSATDGAINIFNWNEFGNISDRFPLCRTGKLKTSTGKRAMPVSLDSMSKFNDSLIFVGCGDGKIRLVSILPNAVLAVVGVHETGMPVEHLKLTPNGDYLASCGHDNYVKFWPTDQYKNLSLQTNSCDMSSGIDSSDDETNRQPRLKKIKKSIRQKLSQSHSFFGDLDNNPMEETDEDDNSSESDDSDDSYSDSDSSE